MTPLVHPGHYRGAQSDDARFKRLQLMIEALTKRVEQLEAKRGPGRPPKDYSEMRSGLSERA
jgi:hypothetical protein